MPIQRLILYFFYNEIFLCPIQYTGKKRNCKPRVSCIGSILLIGASMWPSLSRMDLKWLLWGMSETEHIYERPWTDWTGWPLGPQLTQNWLVQVYISWRKLEKSVRKNSEYRKVQHWTERPVWFKEGKNREKENQEKNKGLKNSWLEKQVWQGSTSVQMRLSEQRGLGQGY